MVWRNLILIFSYRIPYNRLINPTLDVLVQMAQLPVVYKTWRKEAWDFFLDLRFFAMSASNCNRWYSIVATILRNEKDKLEDVLGRISAAPAGIFTSKDQEAILRAHMLRKLTYVLFCGERDQFQPQLPAIQEKLVDVLKQSSNISHAEAFFCLRVMLLRISPRHLANFWPVVLSELMDVLNNALTSPPTNKDGLAIFLQACKFLDMLLILAFEDFQLCVLSYTWLNNSNSC